MKHSDHEGKLFFCNCPASKNFLWQVDKNLADAENCVLPPACRRRAPALPVASTWPQILKSEQSPGLCPAGLAVQPTQSGNRRPWQSPKPSQAGPCCPRNGLPGSTAPAQEAEQTQQHIHERGQRRHAEGRKNILPEVWNGLFGLSRISHTAPKESMKLGQQTKTSAGRPFLKLLLLVDVYCRICTLRPEIINGAPIFNWTGQYRR